jgi:RNA polymerase sigma-70 factor (ECF subfamily)
MRGAVPEGLTGCADGAGGSLSADDVAARRELARLYASHAPRVRRFLRDVLRDDALAWDATQETFARAFGHLELLRDEERAVPWLFAVARNVSFELRKSRARRARVVTEENGEIERARSPRGTPEREALDREALRVVDAALARLSEDRRAVLVLRLDHGFAYEEIARMLGWSLAKVKVEIFRAREVLRETMAAYERGEGDGDGGSRR